MEVVKQEEVMVPDAVVPFQLDENAVKDSFRLRHGFAPCFFFRLYQPGPHRSRIEIGYRR